MLPGHYDVRVRPGDDYSLCVQVMDGGENIELTGAAIHWSLGSLTATVASGNLSLDDGCVYLVMSAAETAALDGLTHELKITAPTVLTVIRGGILYI